jgi:transglutaminase superfamily protein
MNQLRRAVALLVLITFLTVHVLHAVNPSTAWAQAASSQAGPVDSIGRTVDQMTALLATMKTLAAQGGDTSADSQQLSDMAQTLASALGDLQLQLDGAVRTLQSLAGQGTISSDTVNAVISLKATLQNNMANLLSSVATLQTAPIVSSQIDAAKAALAVLKPDSLFATQAPFDRTKLPHRRSDFPLRALDASPAIGVGQTPPTPADLSATVDAQITPAIQALAAQNNSDPAQLFAFVRNTIAFQPYFGSLKGSQLTLVEQAGNDMDQASLLVALLRASRIPARYVAGAVQVPIVQAMSLVGVQTAQAAVNVFARNGIPFETGTSADGTITQLTFFHVWVEAFISNGSKGSGWVQMDAGYKQTTKVAGIDIQQALQFDPNALLSASTSGAVTNSTDPSVTSLNADAVLAEIDDLTANYNTFVTSHLARNATVADVLGLRRIITIIRPVLNTLGQSFPFKTFTPQLEVAELPPGLRHIVNFSMHGFSKRFDMPEIAGKRLTVNYAPATAQDQAIIDRFGGLLNVFPAFIVNLKPQLRLESSVVAEGLPVSFGSSQILRSAFLRPLDVAFDINDRVVTTGAHYAISLDLQRVRAKMLRERTDPYLQQVAVLGPNPTLTTDLIEETLHLTGLTYFAETDAFSDVTGAITGVTYAREPSEAIVSQDLLVLFLFGLPFIATKGSVGIDVKRNILSPVSTTGVGGQETIFMLTSGSFGSGGEHDVFEQLYEVRAVSTERFLQLANLRGVPIFAINTQNVDRIIPRLSTFPVVTQNIIDSVNAGLIAIVPQRNQQYHNWSGMGWIVLDPATGSAGYLLAGGLISSTTASAGGSGAVAADALNAINPDIANAFERAITIATAGEGLGPAAAGDIIITKALASEGVLATIKAFATGDITFGDFIDLLYGEITNAIISRPNSAPSGNGGFDPGGVRG